MLPFVALCVVLYGLGMAWLVRRLGETLDVVEQRVEVLLQQADGTLRLRPLEEDDE